MVRRGERRQEIVDEREPKRHALERRAQDVDRRGGERQPRDGAPSARAPARAALAREEREHREPVLGVRAGDQRPLDRVRLAERRACRRTTRTRRRPRTSDPPDDGAAGVEPVAPESPRRRRPRRIGHDPHRRRRADIDRHARAIGAAGAHAARGAIADGGIPDRARAAPPTGSPRARRRQALIEVRRAGRAARSSRPADVEHLGIPVAALLIEEAGRRGHRDAA